MKRDAQETGGVQRERRAHLDFRRFFLCEVSRLDISGRFDVAPAVVSRDLTRYRTLAPNNVRFDGSSKTYRVTDNFFDLSLDRTLSKGFWDGLRDAVSGLVPCEYPPPINLSAIVALVAVNRVIGRRYILSLPYVSLYSETTGREIIPLALAGNGLCWHVRAFDRKALSFHDFVLTRVRARVLFEDSDLG